MTFICERTNGTASLCRFVARPPIHHCIIHSSLPPPCTHFKRHLHLRLLLIIIITLFCRSASAHQLSMTICMIIWPASTTAASVQRLQAAPWDSRQSD